MEECIFCKIIAKEVPAEILYDGENVIGFPDIAPTAPIHVLIIPRRHIASMNDVTEDDQDTIVEMFQAARRIAKEKGIADSGYQLLIRTGHDGGQEVPHIHLHLTGGAKLA